jgi:hypothetical protein
MSQRIKGINIPVRFRIGGQTFRFGAPNVTYDGSQIATGAATPYVFNANTISSSFGGKCSIWLRTDDVAYTGTSVFRWNNKATVVSGNFASFDPLSITSGGVGGALGPSLWITAEDVVVSNGFVTQINDKSGYGVHFTAASPCVSASYVASAGDKGMPAINFNILSAGYGGVRTMPLTSTAYCNVFIAGIFSDPRTKSATGFWGSIFDTSRHLALPTNKLGTRVLQFSGSDHSLIVATSRANGQVVNFTGSIGHSLSRASGSVLKIKTRSDTPLTDAVQFSGSKQEARRISKFIAGSSTSPIFGNFNPSIGASVSDTGTPNNFFSGSIHEILVYNFSMSVEQETAVENYLLDKYMPRTVDFLQEDAARRPSYRSSNTDYNSLPSIEFAGAASLSSSTFNDLFTGSSGITMFTFVDEKDTSATANDIIFEHSTDFNTQGGFKLGFGTGSAEKILMIGAGNSGGTREWASGSVAAQIFPIKPRNGSIFITKIDRSLAGGAQLQLTANSVPVTLAYSESVDLTSNFGSLYSYIGARAGVRNFFTGSMMEFIIYDHILSQSAIDEIVTYMSGRYYDNTAFSPLTITNTVGSGAVLWLRADDVILSASQVSQWNDKSVKGLHFTSSGITRMAGYNATSSFGGKPAVEFDGTNHTYTSAGPFPLTSSSKATIFLFGDHKFAKNGGTFANLFDSTPAVSLPRNGFNLGWNTAGTSNPNVIFVGTSQASQTLPYEFATGSATSELPPNTPNSGVIITAKYDHNAGVGVKLQLTANYVPVTLKYGGTDGGSLGDFGSHTASLGAQNAGAPASFFSGAIMEVLVYDFALSQDQTVAVINYLSGRYY